MIERLSGIAFLGSMFTLCFLLGLSIWVIAKTAERWSFFRGRRDDLDRVAGDLVARLRQGDFDGADLVLAYSPSIEAALVRPALDWIDGGADAVEAVLDAKRAGKRRDLERSLWPLGVVGRQAPWLGLFGTIIGLIDTLRLLEQGQGRDALSTLWHGMSMGLIPAGAGVIIGLATTIAHGILVDEVLHIDTNVAILSKQLQAILRYKKNLATEFGLADRGLGDDAGVPMAPEIDDDVDRPRSIAELD